MQLSRTPLAVLVSHKDPLIRLGIVTTLLGSPFGPGVRVRLPHEEDFVDLLTSSDVVVTDYDHGLDLCPARASRPIPITRQAHVFVISNRSGEHEIRHAVDVGIKGYVFDDCNPDELIDAVCLVGKGIRHLCSAAAHRMVDSMARESLTNRELEVLRCLVDGYVNKHICVELNIALGTVKAHVKSIFSKLGVATRTQAVALARSRGIVAAPDLRKTNDQRARLADNRSKPYSTSSNVPA